LSKCLRRKLTAQVRQQLSAQQADVNSPVWQLFSKPSNIDGSQAALQSVINAYANSQWLLLSHVESTSHGPLLAGNVLQVERCRYGAPSLQGCLRV
jgi:hypothetical protein